MLNYSQYNELEKENEEELKREIIYRDIGISGTKLLVDNILNKYIEINENKQVINLLEQIKEEIDKNIVSTQIDINTLKEKEEKSELDKLLEKDSLITKIDVTKIYDKNVDKGFIFQNNYKNNIIVEKIGYKLDLDNNKVKQISLKEFNSLQEYYDKNNENVLRVDKTFKDIDIARYFVEEIINNVRQEENEL